MPFKIALLAATNLELEGLQPLPEIFAPTTHGAGMISSLYNISMYLEQQRPKAVLQVGIAGAYPNTGLEVGDIVQITSESVYPYGIEEADGGLTPLWEKEFFSDVNFSSGTLSNSLTLPNIPQVAGITTFTTTGTNETVTKIAKLFPQASVESMEGFALFYACRAKNIPFLEIRAISNMVERRNPALWNIPLALERLKSYLHQNHEILSKAFGA